MKKVDCDSVAPLAELFAPLFLKVDLAPPFPKVDKVENMLYQNHLNWTCNIH